MPGFVTTVDEREHFEYKIDDSTFLLRRISIDKYHEFNRRYTPVEYGEEEDGHLLHISNVNAYKDIIDYVILDWHDVKHPITGEDMICNKASKSKLPIQIMEEVLNFAMGYPAEPE